MLLIITEVFQNIFIEFLKVQEKMFRLPQHRHRTIIPAAWIDQFGRVQQCFTVIALVPPGPLKTTNRASAFDVTVRQEPSLRFRIELLLGVAVEIAIVITGQKDILGDAMMIFSISMGKQIVANAHLLECLQKTLVKPF